MIAMAAALHGPSALEAVEDRPIEIVPDDAYQSALSELVAAPDQATFDTRMDQFVRRFEKDADRLIPQLMWHAARHPGDSKSKAVVGRVLARLSAPKEVIVAALAPHLDNQSDAIRSNVTNLLRGLEDQSATRPPDFSTYRAIIEADTRAAREPQTSLVRFMYDSDPGVALQTVVRACQLRDPDEIKSILWAEHVVADLLWKRRYGFVERDFVDNATQAEIAQLSNHPRWWVRLYAASMVAAHPELGTPDVAKRLEADTDIRVRTVLAQPKANAAEGPVK
jgi:hypothetical protein